MPNSPSWQSLQSSRPTQKQWRLTYRIGWKTRNLVVWAYNRGHARRLFRQEWFSHNAPDYMQSFRVKTRQGWVFVQSMDQGLRRANIQQLPAMAYTWQLPFFKNQQPASLIVHAFSAEHARRQMLNAWMVDEIYDHHFPGAYALYEDTLTYGTCVSPNPLTLWSDKATMIDVIQHGYIALVEEPVMYFCAVSA